MSDGLADVSAIAGLSQLEEVDLSFDKNVADVSALAKLTSLKAISLYSTKVASLAPLAKLDALEAVDVQLTAVKELTPLLASAKTLRALRVPAGTTEAQLAPFKKANPKISITVYKS